MNFLRSTLFVVALMLGAVALAVATPIFNLSEAVLVSSSDLVVAVMFVALVVATVAVVYFFTLPAIADVMGRTYDPPRLHGRNPG